MTKGECADCRRVERLYVDQRGAGRCLACCRSLWEQRNAAPTIAETLAGKW